MRKKRKKRTLAERKAKAREKMYEQYTGKPKKGWKKVDHYLKEKLRYVSRKKYGQKKSEKESGGYCRAGFDCIDNKEYLVVAFPWGTTRKEQREWLAKVQKRFKKIPGGIKVEFKGKTPRVRFKEPDYPQDKHGPQISKKLIKKRNHWIKKRYNQLRNDGIAEHDCYKQIQKELKEHDKKNTFGTWRGKKRNPYLLGLETIKKIVHH